MKGQLSRVKMIIEFFQTTPDTLLVVDVSVEIEMLATLAGIPTIVVRQHGERTDQAHQIAYKNAIGLLAPYGPQMQQEEAYWIRNKTFFSGGFSRYSNLIATGDGESNKVAVLIGSGGTSIDNHFSGQLATDCPNWHVDVLGEAGGFKTSSAQNLAYHGQLQNPAAILSKARIVIGNAGHNTVMEIASLKKRLIVIPEDRPFSEQKVKAAILQKIGAARMVNVEELFTINWSMLLTEVSANKPDWGSIIDANALEKTATYLRAKYEEMFKAN